MPPERVGEGASSEPRTYDLKYVLPTGWQVTARGDARFIPGEVVRVVEQQPGTEGVTYADVERGARGLCDFVWGRDSWGRLNEATRHDALNRARAVLTAALPPQPPEETLRNIAHELARALRARIVEVEGRQPPPNGILWTAEKFLASLPPESPEHQPDDAIHGPTVAAVVEVLRERLKQRGRHMTPESKAFRRGWEAATECIESHFKTARTGGQT